MIFEKVFDYIFGHYIFNKIYFVLKYFLGDKNLFSFSHKKF